MYKKLVVVVVLIVVVVAGLFLADWWMIPREPQLRVGMTEEEVEAVLGKPFVVSRHGSFEHLHGWNTYIGRPDWRGRCLVVTVVVADDRVVSWDAGTVTWPRSSWWDRAKDALGLD